MAVPAAITDFLAWTEARRELMGWANATRKANSQSYQQALAKMDQKIQEQVDAYAAAP